MDLGIFNRLQFIAVNTIFKTQIIPGWLQCPFDITSVIFDSFLVLLSDVSVILHIFSFRPGALFYNFEKLYFRTIM